VLGGDPAPSQKGQSPQLPAYVCCGQTAGWIKIPLGTEVGLGLGHIVSDGHSNGWNDEDATWHEGRPRPRPHCLTWGSTSPKRGTVPIFGPCLLWPNGRPATTEHLLPSCYRARQGSTGSTTTREREGWEDKKPSYR